MNLFAILQFYCLHIFPVPHHIIIAYFYTTVDILTYIQKLPISIQSANNSIVTRVLTSLCVEYWEGYQNFAKYVSNIKAEIFSKFWAQFCLSSSCINQDLKSFFYLLPIM